MYEAWLVLSMWSEYLEFLFLLNDGLDIWTHIEMYNRTPATVWELKKNKIQYIFQVILALHRKDGLRNTPQTSTVDGSNKEMDYIDIF